MPRPAPQDAVIQDLLNLERAEGYCRWLAGFFAPHRGRRIVELGSGNGNLARYVVEGCERAWLLEVDPRLCDMLRARFGTGRVEIIQTDLGAGMPPELAQSLRGQGIDTVFSSNVLEHLPEDLAVLHQAWEILQPGGRTMHIVPAQPWLFNRLDRDYGHLRRYAKARVRAVARDQGWLLDRMQYFNLSGMLGWILSRGTDSAFHPRRVALFERYCLPVERLVARRWVGMPLGLSLFFCLRKP